MKAAEERRARLWAFGAVLALLGISFLGYRQLSRTDERESEMTSPKEESQLTEAAPKTPPGMPAAASVPESNVSEDDYNQEIVGLIPYLSNASLDAIGAQNDEERLALNQLIETAFHQIIDSVISRGTLQEAESGRVTITCRFDPDLREQLMATFYGQLAHTLGETRFSAFTTSRSVDYLNTKMLNFGEHPIVLILQDSGAESVMVTVTTSLNETDMLETYSTTKVVSRRALADNFPKLLEALSGGG